jgi:hypothetical protein
MRNLSQLIFLGFDNEKVRGATEAYRLSSAEFANPAKHATNRINPKTLPNMIAVLTRILPVSLDMTGEFYEKWLTSLAF